MFVEFCGFTIIICIYYDKPTACLIAFMTKPIFYEI